MQIKNIYDKALRYRQHPPSRLVTKTIANELINIIESQPLTEGLKGLAAFLTDFTAKPNVERSKAGDSNKLLTAMLSSVLEQIKIAEKISFLLKVKGEDKLLQPFKISVLNYLKDVLLVQAKIEQWYLNDRLLSHSEKKLKKLQHEIEIAYHKTAIDFKQELGKLIPVIEPTLDELTDCDLLFIEAELLYDQALKAQASELNLKKEKPRKKLKKIDFDISRFASLDLTEGRALSAEIYQWLKDTNNVLIEVGSYTNKNNVICTNCNLIKSSDNEWYVVTGVIGQGVSGIVYEAKFKLKIEHEKAILYPADKIIKSTSLYEHKYASQSIVKARNEAKNQQQQMVQVSDIVVDVASISIFTIMENCGVPLRSLLPLDKDKAFDQAITLAILICNDAFLLDKKEIIHRDIKPDNICIKKEGDKFTRLTYIDFGSSISVDAKTDPYLVGTGFYLAPDSKYTPAVDRWAIGATLGELFCGSQVFKYRLESTGNVNKMRQLPYCYDNLFAKMTIPNDVDPQVLIDIKTLLEKYQSIDPLQRPSNEFTAKFFLLLSQRRAAYTHFKMNLENLTSKWNEINTKFSMLGLGAIKNHAELQAKITTLSKSPKNNFVLSLLTTLEQTIYSQMNALPKVKSHYQTTLEMQQQNISASEFIDPFPKMEPLLNATDSYLKLISGPNFKLLSQFIKEKKFDNSNSTGILEIYTVLSSLLTPLEKLAKLKEIGHDKTKFFANIYSKSHIFSKGRHQNVQLLYERLAKINIKADSNPDDELEKLNEFIAGKSFTH